MSDNVDADVIVVGSGHNGLVTASYLAKWGYQVLVFEKRDTVGGAVCTEDMFGGYKMDVGGSAHFMIHHTPIVEDLELRNYGLEYLPMDPFMSAPFEDGTAVKFYKDIDRTCESIASISGHDATEYRKFIAYWQPLYESVFEIFLKPPTVVNFGKTFILGQLKKSSARRNEQMQSLLTGYGPLIHNTFRSEKIRAALTWWGAQSGPPPGDTASAGLIGWQSMIHRKGAARPRGGSGMLTQALRKYIESNGGRVVSGSPVRKIDIMRNRATGVVLEQGEKYSSRAVVSNAHVKITFLDLLKDSLSPEFRTRIEKIRTGNGFGMVVRCAMDSPPEYPAVNESGKDLLQGLQLLCPSVQYLDDAFADFMKGYPSENPALVVMTFSSLDPSLAPAGKHSVFVWGQYFPYRLRDGVSWESIRRREAEKLLRVVDRFAPGTSDALIDMYIQSPEDIAMKHSMPDANVMHVDMSLDQMFSFRPIPELSSYATPYRGLFLSSAGMHPGGGIFGAAGYNCAHVVRKFLKNRFF